jgi:hypothetical protein
MDEISKIDVDILSLEQLIELHDKIAHCIRELQQTAYSGKLKEFQIGKNVKFQCKKNR